MPYKINQCAICQNKLVEACIACLAVDIKVCIAVEGKCGHPYHLHCIERWLKQRKVCPLDNRVWHFEKDIYSPKSLREQCYKLIAKDKMLTVGAIIAGPLVVTDFDWKGIYKYSGKYSEYVLRKPDGWPDEIVKVLENQYKPNSKTSKKVESEKATT